MFQHCEVLNDDSSGAEDEGIDGVEFVPSEKDGLPAGPTKTPDSNIPSIILSQVNIASLLSPSTEHPTETTNLVCYDDLGLDILAMLVHLYMVNEVFSKTERSTLLRAPTVKGF